MTIITPQSRNIILVTLFIMLTGNLSLFQNILKFYPLGVGNLPFLLSLAVFFTVTTAIFLLAICHGKLGNWLLAVFLLASSQAAYYMDQYGVVIDVVMIDNMVNTNLQEFSGLVSNSLIVRTVLLGIIPAWLVLKYRPRIGTARNELKSRLLLLLALIGALVATIAPFYSSYVTFIREHKTIRMYANPTYYTYSLLHYAGENLKFSESVVLRKVAEDAKEVGQETHKELVILVVGETARADRFSLNGYQRETNPELRKQKVVSMTNVTSCGTSTGESVPCMFAPFLRHDFDRKKALHTENVLDVLARNGVEILWRDNNSDSKGVATRMKYQDFRSPSLNPVCDRECRDVGMLSGLDQFIQANRNKDILIVLHQMGNHGPEYYRRYPPEFERFRPVCTSSELRECTRAEVDNAYDNAILYTDFFLVQVIEFLKKYDGQYETAMLYASDHGESLGENGIYLHAAPYASAPKEQTHIPAIVWLGEHFDYSPEELEAHRDYPLNHDDLFCLLLITFELETRACESKKHILFENIDLMQPPAQ